MGFLPFFDSREPLCVPAIHFARTQLIWTDALAIAMGLTLDPGGP